MQIRIYLRMSPGLAVAVCMLCSAGVAAQERCSIERKGREIILKSPYFSYYLDSRQGLRAEKWENRLTGRTLSLGGGTEVECDLDAAEQRIWISGWKHEGDQRTTHVFLPLAARDKDLTLTLGGIGMYDYREIEARMNGQEVGVRHALRRWNEPGVFDVGPKSGIHSALRFGQDNILVVQCRDPQVRTERMDRLQERLPLPGPEVWPAQFEQYLTVGTPLLSPRLRVKAVEDHCHDGQGEALMELVAGEEQLQVLVTYRWNTTEPILRKFIQIRNLRPSKCRLMNVRLGNYLADATVSDGEQGFPVYLADEFFMSIAHPAGWAIGQDRRVILRQYPGRWLEPDGRFDCMEVVLGTAKAGQARRAFLDHLRARSRRVIRGHDKPYAIYDTFGANEEGGRASESWDLSEHYILGMLDKLGRGKKEAGYQFDLCNTHFWVDYYGDLERFDPQRFPHGLTNIKAKLDELGIAPGLWISSSETGWSIGGNPVVQSTYTHDPAYERALNGYQGLCRATDPIRTMYSTAFVHHILQDGVRLIKCDIFFPMCYNPNHSHLPGLYSTEAIDDAVVQTFHDWDAANSNVFIMLYWGYRSPWWLLHADTIFDPGLGMEAASPGPEPTLYARDSVSVRLDQGQQWCEDVPVLGKDSLGIWLSDWGWNSCMGKERWQEGMIMDICRGSMLAQIWTDYDWLSGPEHKQLADFIALLKAAPKRFAHPRFILGDVWKQEAYGYCCSDGKAAFLALNNCTWSDVSLPLELNSKWGLPDGVQWDIYRWYPDPARLQGGQSAIALRPFEVVLLEAVPAGQPPALPREFAIRPMPVRFSESSSLIPLTVVPVRDAAAAREPSPWRMLKPASAVSANGAVLTAQADLSLLASGRNATPDTYTITAETDLTNVTAFRLEALPDPSLPADGPGRAVNGNFVLSEFSVRAAPLAAASPLSAVALQNAVADFSQESYGGWPVAAALDGNPATGWEIDPEEGRAHEAIFEAREAVRFPGGVKLAFTLEQATPENHTLGRFRLSATSAKPPFKARTDNSGKTVWSLQGRTPACPNGGMLVASAELAFNGQPYMFTDAQSRLMCQGVLAGREVSCQPVLRSRPRYPTSWQAWRIRLEPSAAPQSFELKIAARTPDGAQPVFAGHFIPVAEP